MKKVLICPICMEPANSLENYEEEKACQECVDFMEGKHAEDAYYRGKEIENAAKIRNKK